MVRQHALRSCTFALACVAVLVGLGVCTAWPPARAYAATGREGGWVRPVDGDVVRAFTAPQHRFGPGHVGVDFRAAPGTPVRAAGPGTVTFAGTVAGTRHVVIAHAGGLRTSYSFLVSVSVHRGERVAAGATVGRTGGTGANHTAGVVHLGLRVGDEYVDPMVLFEAVDLTRVVHLAPTEEPFGFSVAEERRSLLEGLGRGVGAVAAATVDAASAVGSTVVGAGAAATDTIAGLMQHHPTVVLGRTMLDYLDERRRCDASAPAADGTGGSGHRALVVAGIDSRTKADGSTLGIPVGDLGYLPDEVSYFSYARDGGRYDARDTYAPIMTSAQRLAAQLRELQRREPGREVDLLAHSQGGVVVLAFLKLVYEPGDAAYPPFGTVVTLSSPLDGAPAATLLDDIRRAPGGDALVRAVDVAKGDRGPDLTNDAVRDLSEHSKFMRRLDAAPLPGNVQITSIGSTYDYTVPADHASADDAERTTVIETVVSSGHTRVVDDADAMRATRTALEQTPLPCRSFAAYIRAEVVPRAISTLESGGRP